MGDGRGVDKMKGGVGGDEARVAASYRRNADVRRVGVGSGIGAGHSSSRAPSTEHRLDQLTHEKRRGVAGRGMRVDN